MLRLVSFSIDYHWACNRTGVADVRPLYAALYSAGLSTYAP